jgi:hypothetical protein
MPEETDASVKIPASEIAPEALKKIRSELLAAGAREPGGQSPDRS